MNSRERLYAVLEGRKPDTTPIFPKIAFANTIACPDISVRDYMTDPECMARSCLATYRKYGWDAVNLHTDISSEGKALGSIYEQPENAPGILKEYLLDNLEDLDKIRVPDPYSTEPMKTVIEAMRIVKSEIGQEAFLVGWTNAPLNVAGQIYDLNELLIALIEEPEEVHQVLERCLETACVYAKALVEAGADAIAYGHATASKNVISKNLYREFALPYEKRLVAAIHECGAKAITHICGNIEDRMDLIAENGSDIVDFDHVCDIDVLRETAPEKVFRGNINPTLFAEASAEEMDLAVKKLFDKRGTGHHFILGSGCEINLTALLDNLKAFTDAGRKYGIK